MENKKIVKIGRTTFGISLILVGITIIIATFCSIDVLRITLMFWPLVLISAGIEILYFSRKDNTLIKYDFFGMVLTAIVIFSSFIFSGVNYFVNKIIYEDEIKEAIIERNKIKEYDTYKNYDSIKIINKNNMNVDVKIVQEEINQINVNIQGEYKVRSNAHITIKDVIDYLELDISKIFEFNDTYQTLFINEYVQEYENVSITVYVDNKSKVIIDGNVNISSI